MKIKLTLLLFAIIYVGSLNSINNFNLRFTHITSDDGLTQNHVTCIFQDEKGFMWFGTRNGLCKYNGYEMQTYIHDKSDAHSLPHNFIRSIFQDKQKRLWVGTDNGLCRYIPEKDEFTQYHIPNTQVTSFAQNKGGTLFCASDFLYTYNEKRDVFVPVAIGDEKKRIRNAIVLAVDKTNTLWIGGSTGLIGYNNDFSELKEVNIASEKGIRTPGDGVLSLFLDRENNLWIGKNGNGVVRCQLSNFELSYYDDVQAFPSKVIRSISQDVQNRMWFGTEKGISILLKDHSIKNIRQDYTDRFALNDNAVYSLISDRSGNMWVGTYFGGVNIFYQDFEQFRYFDVGYGQNQLGGKAVRQIIQENEESLWIATEDGGLYNFNKKTGVFKKVGHEQIKSDNIHSLQIDKSDNLWVGTFLGGLTKYNLKTGRAENYNVANSQLPANNIFSLHVDDNGTVWIGTTLGLRYYDAEKDSFEKPQNNLLSTHFVYYITRDGAESLWIGLRSGGLIRFNTKNGSIRRWTSQSKSNSLSDNFVTSILVDSDKQTWVGTNNGGLFRYKNKEEDFQSFMADGILEAHCIYSLTEDNLNNLWITTNDGLFGYNKKTHEITKYTTEDGLPTNHFNYSSAFKDIDGDIYLGTVKGMVSFNPQYVKQKKDYPDIVFTGLIIGEEKVTAKSPESPLIRDIDNTQRIELSHKQAQLFGIEYAAISLGHTENLIYAIQMEGVNSDWQVVNNQRRIIFSSLPAGKYTFKVRASSLKSTWDDSNMRSIEIIINPPFYLSIWAYCLYIVIFVFILASVLRFYFNRIQEKNAIKVSQLEKQKLKEMNELKRDFFTNISHEFKTPLTLIISPIQQMLSNYELPGKVKKHLELALKNSNSLMNLIKELIEFNKLDATQMTIKLQRGNPLGFITEICNRFRFFAYENDIEFEVEMEDLDESVWFGLTVVEKIVNNLLSNAFKYTLAGGRVKLFAAIIEDENNKLYLNIVVSDTGIGISDANKEKIFDAYYQVNENSAGKKAGWGIGLTLVKNLARLHKGYITFESQVNEGSTFSVLLDVSSDAFSNENRLEIRADESYLEKYNYSNILSEEQLKLVHETEKRTDNVKRSEILIVEDNVEVLTFLIDIFSENYDVEIATNGLEALKKLEENLPDLLISDIMMPEMDGAELCQRIKSNIMTSHIPVILLTAKTGTDNILKGYELGADVYVEKPFHPPTLLLQVQNILRTNEYNRQQFKESETMNIATVAKNKYDEKLLNDIKQVVEDNISNEDFNVSDVVKMVGISRTMLHVKLKSMLDMSIGDYIRNIRLEKAKCLLREGHSISDTAYATGFSDPNYFSKCFKKQIGITPSEFVKG